MSNPRREWIHPEFSDYLRNSFIIAKKRNPELRTFQDFQRQLAKALRNTNITISVSITENSKTRKSHIREDQKLKRKQDHINIF